MNPGFVTIDFSGIEAFFFQPITAIVGDLFAIGLYLFLFWLLVYLAIELYLEYRSDKYTSTWKWQVLAVDVPPMNLQTPKAVEQLFLHIAGALNEPNIAAKFRGGYKQRWFSFEIISIEGYIQFVIRTESLYRDLLESAIYAQYPDAEITEIEDYVTDVPSVYPNDTHDIWATDFGFSEDETFPIRTHDEFEHGSAEEVIKDPMSAMLESFSRIGPGEQMWLQINLEPISNSWKESAIDKINEITGDAKSASKSNALEKIFSFILAFLEALGDQLTGRNVEPTETKTEVPKLSPGQGKLIERMEKKIAKIGMKSKIRAAYVAKKEFFRPERGVPALMGALNQFNIPTANSIIPVYGVSASYYKVEKRSAKRKNLLFDCYKKRKVKEKKLKGKSDPFILNVEELATIWHFPMSHVKTPMVQKVAAKASEPPVGLPLEHIEAMPEMADIVLPTEDGEEIRIPSAPPKEEKKDDAGFTSDMTFG